LLTTAEYDSFSSSSIHENSPRVSVLQFGVAQKS